MRPSILAGLLGGSARKVFASISNFWSTSATVDTSSGTQLTYFVRQKVVIGSGSFSSLNISFSGNTTGGQNAYTIQKVALERMTPNVTVPVTFSGGRTKVINALDIDIQTDDILPSSFGLATFDRSSEFWIRYQITVTTAGHVVPVEQAVYDTAKRSTHTWSLRYDPATFTMADVDTTGAAFSGTGFAFTTANVGKACLIGTPSGAIAPVFGAIGDSILCYQNDVFTGTNFVNVGFFNRALVDATDYRANAFAACNFAVPGTQANTFNASAGALVMLGYCTHIVEEYGTNGDTGQAALWATLVALGKPVIRTKLLTKTSSTDAWLTVANQTYDASWTPPSAARVVFDASLNTKYSAGDFSALIDFQPDVLDSVDRWKWKAGTLTADGLHPNAAAHTLMAARLRAHFLTL